MMKHIEKIAIIIIALNLVFAIKVNYGGQVSIRLNEPVSFSNNPSNYSNLIFYSLLYENLFYMNPNGDVWTNLFKKFGYDSDSRILTLELKDNLSYSNGKPVKIEFIKNSIQEYLSQTYYSAKELAKIVKKLDISNNSLNVELMYDLPTITSHLAAPELVLIGEDAAFSGLFFPVEWVKGEYIMLAPNPYYAGGRTYLDYMKVVFFSQPYPDIFLSNPGGFSGEQFLEMNAGIYQNIYLNFPGEQVGQNTRMALFSLLKQFFSGDGYESLNSLTSDEESPVSIDIKSIPYRRMRSILKFSKINLYILSSLKDIEVSFGAYLQKKDVPIETVYVGSNQLSSFIETDSAKYLLLEKMFTRRTPIEEKIGKVIREMTFSRFNEKYLKLMEELNEIKNLNNEELLMDQIAKIIDKIINDGFLLPIAQKKISLFINKRVHGVTLDYYGRPLFPVVRVEK